MSITAGVLTVTTTSSTTATITSTAATAGTGPYTQQLYGSVVSGFTPGAGNLFSGATALVNTVTGLIPNTTYYFEMIYTDTGASNATADSLQVSGVTQPPVLSQNSIQQQNYLGVLDQSFNYNTRSVILDASVASPVYAGCAVKAYSTNSALGGPMHVVPCTADTDAVLGFVVFNFKNVSFSPGNALEISRGGNVQYLYSTTTFNAGAQVCLDLTTNGGVGSTVSTHNIVGYAENTATAPGQLVRINIQTPSFLAA
jgi:hypothetical protein